jgi:phosphotransacetylase
MGFEELAQKIRGRGPRALVVVEPDEASVLEAVARAVEAGIARPVLVGDAAAIARCAEERGVDIGGWTIVDARGPQDAALAAMRLVREGRADALMKGRISTPDLLRTGLRSGLKAEGRLLSHVTLFDHPRFDRLLVMTDGAVVPFPTLAQRVQILRNAVETMRALGVASPRIAGLSSTEVPDEKIPSSIDMARLGEMFAAGGALEGCGEFAGPIDLFGALIPHAAEVKGITGPVAGRADILHCPDVVAGNLMGKALLLFAEGMHSGGCVVGGAVPIVLLSRASPADDKYCSIVAALSCAG